MELRHRVALNDVQLDELDERILVLGVNDGAGRETLNAVSRFGGFGQRVTTRHRDTLDITVTFGLRIKAHDMTTRSELFELVSAWAMAGGWLTLNYKPGEPDNEQYQKNENICHKSRPLIYFTFFYIK